MKTQFVILLLSCQVLLLVRAELPDSQTGRDDGHPEKDDKDIEDQSLRANDLPDEKEEKEKINLIEDPNAVMFEESESEDESLIDQMVRLSEKLKAKKKHDASVEMAQIKKTEREEVHKTNVGMGQESRTKKEVKDDSDQTTGDDSGRFESVENIKQTIDNEFKKHVEKTETVTEQIKKLADKIIEDEKSVEILAELDDDTEENFEVSNPDSIKAVDQNSGDDLKIGSNNEELVSVLLESKKNTLDSDDVYAHTTTESSQSDSSFKHGASIEENLQHIKNAQTEMENEVLERSEKKIEKDTSLSIQNIGLDGKSSEGFSSLSEHLDNTLPPNINIEPSQTVSSPNVNKMNSYIKLSADESIRSATSTHSENEDSSIQDSFIQSSSHKKWIHTTPTQAIENLQSSLSVPSKEINDIPNVEVISSTILTHEQEHSGNDGKDTNAGQLQIEEQQITAMQTEHKTQHILQPSSSELTVQDHHSATQSDSLLSSEAIIQSRHTITGNVEETRKQKADKDGLAFKEPVQLSKEGPKLQTQTVYSQRKPEDSIPHVEQSASEEVSEEIAETQDEEVEETQEDRDRKEQAQQYYEEGEKLVNTSYKRDYPQAYEYFKLAAERGHHKAKEYLGFGMLLGDHMNLDPEAAMAIFQELSAKGSPKGQLGLGFMYSAGLAVNSSQAKALIYFTFAALGGDPLAQMVLGYRYLSGIGVEAKCETALQYYKKVATTVAESTSSGSPVVQRVRLQEHAENQNTGGSLMDDDLLQYYEFLAEKGDVQAQVTLGQLFYQGARGVPLSHERAHHYFSMAAESGNSNAHAYLGKMHSEGSPVVKQDNHTAFQYFKKAADKGNPIGQGGLGVMYLYGKGVDRDYQKAQRYFTAAADQGWVDGQLHLGIMHFSGKGVRRDYKMAVKYFNLASQGGHVLAFYHLAQMHGTGTGVLRNCHTAVELYKNVAERGGWAVSLMEAHQLYKDGNVDQALLKYTFMAELGYEVAQSNVAYILDQGESSLFAEKETYQRALLHWTRAASQGSTVARLKMGDYHYYGYGTEIDYETAATHYRLATEQQHNAQAMFNLGYMHENGLGLKQDVHLAKRFYDMAAETSGDAYIPVNLALLKLGLFYGVDVFSKELEGYNNFVKRLDVRYSLGPNWDIYLATMLGILLGIVMVLRRAR